MEGFKNLETGEAAELLHGLVEKTIEKYSVGKKKMHFAGIWTDIRHLVQEAGDFDHLRNKKVLDLGCGSTLTPEAETYLKEALLRNEDIHQISNTLVRIFGVPRELTWGLEHGSRDFEPWVPRVLHEAGVEVIGIDKGNLEGEEFEHYSLDLARPDSLKFFPDHSFDVVHSKLLFDSMRGFVRASPFDKAREEEIQRQIHRLLKPDGKIVQYEP